VTSDADVSTRIAAGNGMRQSPREVGPACTNGEARRG
jgi:hypothetical protein